MRIDSALPIERSLPALLEHLRAGSSLVLQAPPGAGKTTRVPLALLHEPWLGDRKVIMLEPRRLATRAAARRMAAMLGESVGATVGFRVRGETRVGAATRIEVVTEGVLTRMLLDDPTLDHVGALLFDEFHERSLHADLGLALALQTQALLRPDLRIVVMSATLAGTPVSALLGGAPIVTSVGRQFPVDVRHITPRQGARIEEAVASAVRLALANDDGSVLAFLPGMGEIRRCMDLLAPSVANDVRILPLFGELSPAEQDAAIAPPAPGERKVVLATSIAETSLTIEGVRVVVDGGVSRVSRFSAGSGMSRLETIRVSRSSAAQRCGRAGRMSPGVCYRLWPAGEDAQLLEHARPEVLEADLSTLVLDLAAAGITDAGELRWLDIPPASSMAHARELLVQLGALDADGRITAHGREMSAFATHPRLAHMLLTARSATACAVAALVEERDIVRRDAARRDVDMRTRVALVDASDARAGADVDRDALRRVREQYRTWRRLLHLPASGRVDENETGRLLALAYPERVAQWRGGRGHRYLLRNGSGAVLADPGVLADAAYLAVADIDERSPHARIFLAAPVSLADLESVFADSIERVAVVEWDAAAGAVTAVRREVLGAIVLYEGMVRDVDADVVADVLLDALQRQDGIALPWSDAARRLRERVMFLRTLDGLWPDMDGAALHSSMSRWLRPHLHGLRRRADVDRLPLHDILLEMLTWEQRRALDTLAPSHVEVPTGSRLPVDYSDPLSPVLAVRLQEMFGLADTPRVGGGRIPLTLHLLSPAHRPVQVTKDLAGFWRSSYFDVRKDLRGRYPKHSWPEDPMSATPTRRARPRPLSS
ncbi:MAG: ATP-dependent helicase HrpB [Gemmatimonadetes bacterium]|nr:ATP-dependent helicase HrpB [Gemmatimonadota bacterium]